MWGRGTGRRKDKLSQRLIPHRNTAGLGIPQVVQWLRLHASSVRGLILDLETRIPCALRATKKIYFRKEEERKTAGRCFGVEDVTCLKCHQQAPPPLQSPQVLGAQDKRGPSPQRGALGVTSPSHGTSLALPLSPPCCSCPSDVQLFKTIINQGSCFGLQALLVPPPPPLPPTGRPSFCPFHPPQDPGTCLASAWMPPTPVLSRPTSSEGPPPPSHPKQPRMCPPTLSIWGSSEHLV